MVLFENKKDCCGCGACASVCTKKAITLREDELGFLYPDINNDLCIDCGLCKKVCGYQNNKQKNEPKKVYAAVSTKTDIIKSASGGVFAALASSFINDGGVVCGATLQDNTLEAKHICIDSDKKLSALLGSKYVQSSTLHIFSEVRDKLNNNKRVLFSGTPCQVSSLYKFLGDNKNIKNLFTIDLICHGVPSQRLFSDYTDSLSKNNSKPVGFNFRDKSKGIVFTSKITYSNGKSKYIPCGASSYFTFFMNGDSYRESCYSCPFAEKRRVGDITIGDYWGIKKQHPEIFDGSHPEFDVEKGISCILINTEQGKALSEQYSSALSVIESSFESVSAENFQLLSPSKKGAHRDAIFKAYTEKGYSGIEEYFRQLSGIKYYVAIIKSKIPLKLKTILKKIL